MQCNVTYVGKMRNGVPKYYCVIHKSVASDKQGNALMECLCKEKDLYSCIWDMRKNKFQHIKIVYENILENKVPQVFIDGNIFNGVLKIDESILNYKDLGGVFLAKLNGIDLEDVECNHCHKKHSDNGKFAYTPHRTHFCQYCGHLFRVQQANVGSEFAFYFSVPSIQLKSRKVNIATCLTIEYDLFERRLLINGEEGDILVLNGNEIPIVEYLNDLLKEEY